MYGSRGIAKRGKKMKPFFQFCLVNFRRVLYRINYFVLRNLVSSVGTGVRVYGMPYIQAPENISIGCDCTINHGVVLNGRGGIHIGNNVRISSGCVIETGMLTLDAPIRVHSAKSIVVEDNVWIATRAILLPGVKIGKNSIVAAGALVTRDVPENSIAKGVPARTYPLS